MKKKRNIIFAVLCLIILILILLIVLLYRRSTQGENNGVVETTATALEIESGIDWDGKMSNMPEETVSQETITIPGYSNLYVSEVNKTIRLVNPEENTVYLQYVLKYEDTTVYETKAIAPGKMIEANLYDVLELGEYNLTMQINTYDINTETACNGATQSITLLVK